MTINPYPFSSLSQNILLTGKVNDKDCNVNSDYEDGDIGDGYYEKEGDIDEDLEEVLVIMVQTRAQYQRKNLTISTSKAISFPRTEHLVVIDRNR